MQIKAAEGRDADVKALERLLDRGDVPATTRKRIEQEIAQIPSGEKAERDSAYDIELYFGRSDNWVTPGTRPRVSGALSNGPLSVDAGSRPSRT